VTSPLYFSSSKLYTVDFFELVRRRLTPDGVYVTWLDVNIGDRGCEIVLEALSRVFPHAWMLYIKSGYFLLAASNDELAFSQFGAVAGNARLGDDLAERHTLPTRLLVHSLLLTDAYALRAVGPVPLNTRDFPALEYHMARGDYGFARLPDRLRSVFDLGSVQSAIARVTPWEAGESALNAELRLPEKSRVRTLLFERLLPERSDWIAFDRAALALAGESGRAGVFYKYGKLLRQERRPLAAAEAFARAFELDPQDARAAYYLGRTRYELGECEAALPPLLAAWEQARDTDVPLVLASCLARLGRFEPALDWLDAAQLLGSRSDAGEVAFWRGFAYEKLGRAQEAEQSYVDALGAEKRYASAQQALDRLRSRSQVGG